MSNTDDPLRDALSDLHEIDLRAENHETFGDLFADFGLAERLNRPNWQILYGSQGTGKTFQLKVCVERYNRLPHVYRILPIYIRMQDCIAPPNPRLSNDYEVAHASFVRFLDGVVRQLIQYKRARRIEDTWSRRIIRTVRRERDDVDEKLRLLKDLIRTGTEIQTEQSRYVIEEDEAQRRQSSRRIGGDFDIDARSGASLHGSVGGEHRKERSTERKVHRTSGGVVWPDYSGIRRLFEELVELLELKRIDIFVDDWSHISVTGGSAQATFAQELKLVFQGARKISIKLASNWYQTALFDPETGYGLREGHDIWKAANLDEPLLTLPQFMAFFEELLYKRLALEHHLGDYVENGTGRVTPAFAEALFTDGSLQALLLGCEGVPRRILVAIDYLVSRALDDRPWSESQVAAAVEAAAAAEPAVGPASAAERVLQKGLKPSLTQTASAAFVVARDDEDAQRRLAVLIEEGLVHESTEKILAPRLREQFAAYVVEDQVWRDWTRARQYQHPSKELAAGPRVPWIQDATEAADYLVEGQELDIDPAA